MIAAIPERDRLLWGCAFYAGLRRGELRALRWGDIDTKTGPIRVSRSWDDVSGAQAPKSIAGVRKVPIIPQLWALLPWGAAAPDKRPADDLVVPCNGDPSKPFEPSTIRSRAIDAWDKAKLKPVILHGARHTFASFLIAAGCNVKTVSTLMGHASVGITLDRYGHMLPGGEDAAGQLLDAFLRTH